MQKCVCKIVPVVVFECEDVLLTLGKLPLQGYLVIPMCKAAGGWL
jgi:hypothetical protein